jgi:nucleoside-diphosphate-sugar epimerase
VHGRFEVNSDGTKNLVAWLAPVLPGKRFVYTGTLASVDQNYPTQPASETTPCRPKTPYGRTKLEAEEYLCRCSQEIGFEFTILRLCTIVGRGYRAGGMFSLFLDLLRKRSTSMP